MGIAYVSTGKEFSKHLLPFSVPPVLGSEPEPCEMQASAPLNYIPCLSFGWGDIILLCSSSWPGTCNLPVSVSECQDSTPVLPCLGHVSPLTLESPPSRKSLSLLHQFIDSKLELPSTLFVLLLKWHSVTRGGWVQLVVSLV